MDLSTIVAHHEKKEEFQKQNGYTAPNENNTNN